MKSKAIAIILFATLCATLLFTPQTSWAGSPQSHRWEGVAIGIGAAIIGSAILKAHQQPPVVVAPYRPAAVYAPGPPPRSRGHWEVRKEWVPAQVEKVWNPGHYDRKGRWVAGHWIHREVQPGYWTQTRVWVSR
ncbi:hypothetical protein [Desulfatitalea alkaliphila]|uniref:YXWGXW repeat-containing protein n=1 Tax=Desulfatitalea alkaliphila TaxID=2929485 RepID=A0AA41R5P9_9BACT|nr:hypothetical protein [Desulfatitalea alkaliphila]MCJ8502281.1 hypothetical protein [Desulfatitalea alkaliphila]